ncbi:MAG TPA: tetratricopeptide repeat protein, partial [Bdellovibrionota bacterium]|nr:tetratricopeptide repeat protein [Bdellovibrionota bacterium]
VGYSAITNRDEKLALELLEEHRALIRPLFVEHGGREVKTIGDAFLAEFDSALEAVKCGIRIQERLGERNLEAQHARRIKVRIGIHLGDIVVSDNDVYGDGVNIAARLEQMAEPGSICFSQQVYDQVHNKLDHPLTLRYGELRNIRKEARFYQVKPVTAGAEATSPGISMPGLAARLRRLRIRRRRTAFAAGALAAFAALATFVSVQRMRGPAVAHDTEARPSSAAERIAVLPFRSSGFPRNEEYVVDAVSEDLILALSRLPGARVIAPSSVARFAGSKLPLREIAAELHAGTLIEGSLRKSGDRLKVSVSLVDPASETTIWAEEHEDRSANVFELQAKIARSVTTKLRMRRIASIPPGGTQEQASPDKEAFMLYIKGRFFLNQRTKEGFEKGIALFKKAIEIDPSFQGPYVGLANSYGFMGYYEYMSPKEALLKGMHYSERALTLDPESPDALSSTASRKMYYDHDWQGAEAFFQRALEVRPNYPSAHSWYSDFLVARGRIAEARREISLALDLDPLSLVLNTAAGRPEYFSGDYDAAIRRFSSVLEMDPSFLPARLWLGRAYLMKGDHPRALEVLRAAAARAPESAMVRAALAQALARAGRTDDARKLRAELEAAGSYVPSYDIAAIDLALGERQRALANLEKAYEERSYHVVFAALDPSFSAIAEEPRFRAIVERVRSPRH